MDNFRQILATYYAHFKQFRGYSGSNCFQMWNLDVLQYISDHFMDILRLFSNKKSDHISDTFEMVWKGKSFG